VDPPQRSIRWNANKIYLAELAAAGITMPDTIFVEPEMELDLSRVCASRGWPSAVVKPTISATAHCTERRFSGLVRQRKAECWLRSSGRSPCVLTFIALDV
jgi:hypothetical protein